MKAAVVLMNLGGPLKKEDVRPFLTNFFMDKNIIAAPYPLRWMIARYIAKTRSQGAAKTAYAALNYKSPLLENTKVQAEALQTALHDKGIQAKTFISMRYWHPLAKQVVQELEEYAPDKLILLPLYPQFSTTTTGSSLEDFWQEVQAADGTLHARWNDEMKVGTIGCYPLLEGFIKASADNIRKALEKAPAGTRVLLSAHGLPEKIINGGDPYQMQCEKSAAAIAAAAGLQDGAWEICYQSRVGPLKWIGPSTEEALHKAAHDKVPGVIIYPHAFVSEHVETLVEIDMEYRIKAGEMGIPYFDRVPTVSTHPLFINGLAEAVEATINGQALPKICGNDFRRCGCKAQG